MQAQRSAQPSLRPAGPSATPAVRPAGPLGLSPFAWMSIGLVVGLMVMLYWPNFARLWRKTNPINGQDAGNWSHSVLVPVIGLAYLWLKRAELRLAEVRPVLPTSRLPWLLGGGVVLAFASAATWLFGRAVGGLGGVLPWLLPAAGAFVFASLLDVAHTLTRDGIRRTGRARIAGGALLGLAGTVGVLADQAGVLEPLLAALPFVGAAAGYVGALCMGAAFLGLLVVLLDWGVGCLVGGVLLSGYGIWPGMNDYLKDLGMVLATFGAVLTLTGWGVMRIAWFPIAFLIFAIPWPELVYTKLAMPLQFLAANVAVVTMNLAGVDTYVEGTRIIISKAGGEDRILEVATACAGMRSLMTFLTAGGAVAFLFGERPVWQRLVIVASAIPIAIGMNVLRVSGQGLLDVYVSESMSQGFAHSFAGLVMLVPAFFLLLGVVWIVDNLFVEVDDEEDQPVRGTPAHA